MDLIMRAQRVIESVGFERGMDPKASLGLGGITPKEIYKDFYNKFIDSYTAWAMNLIGKTIYGDMEIWFKDNRGGWSFGKTRKYRRVKVSGIRQVYFSEGTPENLRGGFEIEAEDGHWYKIYPESKIWIQNES